MSATLISFQTLPKFGFAHHLYTEDPWQEQKNLQKSFVLVYVKSGHLTAQIYGRTFEAPAGSILVLFRHVPFRLSCTDGSAQDYCSIQVYADYSFDFIEDSDDFPAGFSGLSLPVVTLPSGDTEQIKKDMYAIVSSLSISRELYSTCATMALCGILYKLDALYRQKLHRGKSTFSYWEDRIKRYVAGHIQSQITLKDLAQTMGKTPNYLNSVFSEAAGISIHQYINREKMRLAATLMETRQLSFQDACENVGITDLSHGYRLFKRHVGVTPKKYMSGEHLKLQL